MKWIYNIFLAGIAVIALLLISSIFPIPGNFKVLVVQSGSMRPAVKTGSLVIVRPAREYGVGDIITFNSGRTAPTTHRIYEIKNNNGFLRYITKGDANNAPDPDQISQGQIMGKVLFSLPYAGFAVDTVKKPWGFFLIIVVPAMLVISEEAKKIWQEAKKIKRKRSQKNEEKK